MSESKNWVGTVMHRRRVIEESDNSTDYDKDSSLLQNRTEDTTAFCTNCCSCKVPVKLSSKSKSKNLLRSRSEPKVDSYSSYREQLEMKILGEGLTERIGSEKHIREKQQLEEAVEILRSLSIYVQCADMKNKMAKKLYEKLASYAEAKDGGSDDKSKSINEELSVKLCEITRLTSEASELPEEVNDVKEEYEEKHRDFVKAANNFSYILQSKTSVSNTQLRKLESQFEEIQSTYFESKTSFDSHLKSTKSSLMNTLKKCLQSLSPLLGQLSDQDKQMGIFLKSLKFDDLISKSEQRLPRETVRSSEKLNGEGNGKKNQRVICTCSPKNEK